MEMDIALIYAASSNISSSDNLSASESNVVMGTSPDDMASSSNLTTSFEPIHMDLQNITFYQEQLNFQFYALGVAGNIIAGLGIPGNILSIVVLSNRRMKSSTSSYLISLAIYDTIVLIGFIVSFALPTMLIGYNQYSSFFPYIQPYAYPIALTAQTCSIYTTVGFTVERYIAVCYPLKSAKFCTISRARKAIFIIFASSVIYNIPRMLEYKVVTRLTQVDNVTNISLPSNEKTALGHSEVFRHIYFIYMNICVMLLLPFITLAVLNTLLIRAVRRSDHAEGKVTNKQRRENNLTVMLISVVIVFLLCQITSIADNIFATVLSDEMLQTLPFIKLTGISSLTVITNSAVNFYLYCVFGQKFRQVSCRIFCRCLGFTKQFLHHRETTLLHVSSTARLANARQRNAPSVSDVSPQTSPDNSQKAGGGAPRFKYNKLQNGNSSGISTSVTMSHGSGKQAKYSVVSHSATDL